jgi:hypothetical protein
MTFSRSIRTHRVPSTSLSSAIRSIVCVLAIAGSFVSASLARAVDDSDELRVVDLALAATRKLADGRFEVDLEGSLRNRSTGTYTSAVATWKHEDAGLEIVDGELRFDRIGPRSTAESSDTLTLRLSRRLHDALATLLGASTPPFEIHGTEHPMWAAPLVPIDVATDAAFVEAHADGPNTRFHFDADTTLLAELVPGDLLGIGDWVPQRIPLDRLPALVISVDRRNGSRTRLETRRLGLGAALENGTLSAAYELDPAIETTSSVEYYIDSTNGCVDSPSEVEGDAPICGFRALPIRFDDIEIVSGVHLRGEILLRSSGIKLETRIREGRLDRVVTGIDVGAYITAELEATTSVSTGPIEETIWTVTLPSVTVMLGGFPVTLTPIIDLEIGVEADLTAGTVLGIHQNVNAGVETGFQNGEYFAEPSGGVSPVSFSPPRLTSDTAATGRVWAAVDVLVLVQGTAGPFLRATSFAELDVSPVREPWWSVNYGLDGSAGIELQLLGLEVARWESNPWNWFEDVAASAETVTLPAVRKALGEDLDGEENEADEATAPRTSGEELRWAVAIDPSTSGHEDQKVIALANGDALITSRTRVGPGSLVRVDARGNVLWLQDLPLRQFPVGVVELSNGHLAVAGEDGHNTWIAEHDADGERLWSRAHDFELATGIHDFVGFEDENGAMAYLVICGTTVSTIRERDPFIARLDSTGSVVWAKRLESPGSDSTFAATRLSDGNFALVGTTEADVGTDILVNATSGGLVLKMDGDGNILWSTVFPARWGGYFESVVEGPDGFIYAAGTTGAIITTEYPKFWVAKVSPLDGSGTHASLGEDFFWSNFLSTGALDDDSPVVAGQGRSAYDTIYGLTTSGDRIIAVGATGLGESRAAQVFALTTELGVAWATSFDGGFADVLTSTAPAPDGIWVVGHSNSFSPLGVGGESAILAMKLPFEGRLGFDAEAGASCRYVQPESFASSTDGEFESDGITQGPVSYGVLEASWVEGTAPQAPVLGEALTIRLTTFPSAGDHPPPPAPRFVRGDCDGDGELAGVSDAIRLLRHNFIGRQELACRSACDANGDGRLTGVSDAVYMLSFLFLGGAAPAAPYPDCGEGTLASDDELGCVSAPEVCRR